MINSLSKCREGNKEQSIMHSDTPKYLRKVEIQMQELNLWPLPEQKPQSKDVESAVLWAWNENVRFWHRQLHRIKLHLELNHCFSRLIFFLHSHLYHADL